LIDVHLVLFNALPKASNQEMLASGSALNKGKDECRIARQRRRVKPRQR
jgi:hypothetical protein